MLLMTKIKEKYDEMIEQQETRSTWVKGLNITKHANEEKWVNSILHSLVFSKISNVNVFWCNLEEKLTQQLRNG